MRFEVFLQKKHSLRWTYESGHRKKKPKNKSSILIQKIHFQENASLCLGRQKTLNKSLLRLLCHIYSAVSFLWCLFIYCFFLSLTIFNQIFTIKMCIFRQKTNSKKNLSFDNDNSCIVQRVWCIRSFSFTKCIKLLLEMLSLIIDLAKTYPLISELADKNVLRYFYSFAKKKIDSKVHFNSIPNNWDS